MRPVRILSQYLYFFPRIGGIESHMYYLYRNLVKKGNSVTIITSKSEKDQLKQQIIDGIKVIRKGTSGIKIIGKRNYLGWIKDFFFTFPELLKNARKTDILHAHTFFFALPMGVAKKLYKKPLVTTLHTVEFLKFSKNFFGRLFLFVFLKNTDFVIATSKETKDLCEKVINKPIISIVNGIDTNLFKQTKPFVKKDSPDKKILICSRRLVPKNGVDYLIKALALIIQKLNVELYITGDGTERPKLEELSEKLNVKKFVHFLGKIDNKELPKYYSSCDLMVVPSLYEGTSISALEAMSCGVPVAASDIGGLPEIISEETGILFKAKNVKDMANKIIALLRDKNLKKKGAAARELVVKNWDIKHIARLHEKIYDGLLKNV